MEPFPLSLDLMQAFPIGAMPSLLALVSALAAQHGPKNVRRVCIELAANDDLWAFVEGGLERPGADGARDVPPTQAASADAFGVAVANYEAAAADEVTKVTSGTEVTKGGPLPPPKKTRGPRKSKTNGVVQ